MDKDKLNSALSALDESADEITFQAIVEAKLLGCLESLNEASLGRVYQHVQRQGEKSWAIITSWRAGLPKQENIARMAKLKASVRALGLGFFSLKGHWRECQDSDVPYEKCPEDALIDSVEPSLWVNGITKDQAEKLMRVYEQDAIVFAGPETGGKVTLLFRRGTPVNLGKFHPNAIAQAYSQVKGRPFRFEGFEYPAQSWAEKMMEQRMLE